jgi:hypothetical protein
VAAVAEKTLFDRLGGMAAIEAEIDDFLGNVLADDRINKRFAETDAADLRQKLIDQVCEAAGGPCKYTGEDMVEAHKDMNVTDAEFDALSRRPRQIARRQGRGIVRKERTARRSRSHEERHRRQIGQSGCETLINSSV